MKKPYVAKRGKLQWVICRWDTRGYYVDGCATYRTKAEAVEAMRWGR